MNQKLNTDALTLATFAEHVGSRFRLPVEGAPLVELELVEAKSLATHDPNRSEQFRSEPFALLFRVDSDVALPQQIYRIEHDSLDDIELFLVPIGQEDEGLLFEAVFN